MATKGSAKDMTAKMRRKLKQSATFNEIQKMIRLSPKLGLNFSPSNHTASIFLENLSDKRLAFKMRAKNTDNYLIAGYKGTLRAKEMKEIRIRINDDYKCVEEDAFLVLINFLPKMVEEDGFEKLFPNDYKSYCYYRKFECKWQEPVLNQLDHNTLWKTLGMYQMVEVEGALARFRTMMHNSFNTLRDFNAMAEPLKKVAVTTMLLVIGFGLNELFNSMKKGHSPIIEIPERTMWQGMNFIKHIIF